MENATMKPAKAAGRSPAPLSRRAEIVLLAIFAMNFDLPHHLRELSRASDLLGLEPAELAAVLEELQTGGYAVYDAEEHTVRLTPHANALFLALAEQGLPDEILERRPLQEQAEALVIWRLALP